MMLNKKSRRRIKKLETNILKRTLEAEFLQKYFPKGDRHNRMLYLKKIEGQSSFKKDLRMMKEILNGGKR